jgi:ABC-type polysaccharide/polyol phosphate transport system ATPase subunit
MSGALDVRLDRVWKQYRLGVRRRAGTFWALKDVRFDVPRGASIGVIGRNGAGKSTLLKLLAGITAPTRGRIEIDGRVAALIEVGSGFHPELTGRENVFLSGAILGMRRHEIGRKLSSIVDFAGVEPFIDTPVKWYSSGMYVRLGFAIAAHLEPEVLLVDEVLAVGDAEFQARCLQRIQELRRTGVTTLLISHDLTAVQHLCDQAVLLERGEVTAIGDPADVVSEYHRRLVASDLEAAPNPSADGSIKLTNLTFRDPHRQRSLAFRTGGPLVVSLRYTASRVLPDVVFEMSYYTSDGRTLLAAATTRDSDEPLSITPPGGVVEFTCAALALQPGGYYVAAVARDRKSGHVLDWWDGGTTLYVEPGAAAEGQFYMPHTWRVERRLEAAHQAFEARGESTR